MTLGQLVTITFIILYLIEAISNFRLRRLLNKIFEEGKQ